MFPRPLQPRLWLHCQHQSRNFDYLGRFRELPEFPQYFELEEVAHDEQMILKNVFDGSKADWL